MTSVRAPLLRGEAVCWGACAQSLLGSQGRPRGELDPLWQQAGVRAAGRVLGLSVGPLTRTELRDTGGGGRCAGMGPPGWGPAEPRPAASAWSQVQVWHLRAGSGLQVTRGHRPLPAGAQLRVSFRGGRL